MRMLSTEQLLSLVNGLGAIVWEAEPETFRFTFVSEEAERILGYPAQDWLDDPDFWVHHTHPDDVDRCATFCREATRRGEDHEFEYRMHAADGRIVWLRDIVVREAGGGRRAPARRHRARHHLGEAGSGGQAPDRSDPGTARAGDENGGRRAARRRRRARLQQPADRHRRLCRARVGDAQHARLPCRGSRRDQAGRASGQPADAAAPGVRPQAGAPPRSARHQRASCARSGGW